MKSINHKTKDWICACNFFPNRNSKRNTRIISPQEYYYNCCIVNQEGVCILSPEAFSRRVNGYWVDKHTDIVLMVQGKRNRKDIFDIDDGKRCPQCRALYVKIMQIPHTHCQDDINRILDRLERQMEDERYEEENYHYYEL